MLRECPADQAGLRHVGRSGSIITAPRAAVLILRPVLKLARHHAGGIAAAIADIEIDAVAAAGHRIPAAMILAATMVFSISVVRFAVVLTVIASPRGLILRGERSVRIAEPVARAQIPTVPARRRMGVDAVLDFLD